MIDVSWTKSLGSVATELVRGVSLTHCMVGNSLSIIDSVVLRSPVCAILFWLLLSVPEDRMRCADSLEAP